MRWERTVWNTEKKNISSLFGADADVDGDAGDADADAYADGATDDTDGDTDGGEVQSILH